MLPSGGAADGRTLRNLARAQPDEAQESRNWDSVQHKLVVVNAGIAADVDDFAAPNCQLGWGSSQVVIVPS
jgi:hypothetical protein